MSDSVQIWHNPRCSKSRKTLDLLREKGIEPEVRLYLENPPTPQELTEALRILNKEPRDLLRTTEAAYKERRLHEDNSDAAIVAAMIEMPILIERPIVLRGERGCLGRPPENVLELLDS